MTDHIPTIIQIAAWIYVLKQFSIVFVVIFGFGVVPAVCYVIARLTGSSHKVAIDMIKKSMEEGVKDALDDF